MYIHTSHMRVCVCKNLWLIAMFLFFFLIFMKPFVHRYVQNCRRMYVHMCKYRITVAGLIKTLAFTLVYNIIQIRNENYLTTYLKITYHCYIFAHLYYTKVQHDSLLLSYCLFYELCSHFNAVNLLFYNWN